MSVEFLVKLRDAAQMIIDAANEQLEELARILVYNPMPQGVFFLGDVPRPSSPHKHAEPCSL